ncbi:hypothetical protein [Sphingomonas sp.]|jgi:hypothetical protein|uniref:hypothetical protein n=1 Tax=Sphingomonas sp. TaxID=28214 RepID=UPI002ED97AC8
MFASKPLASLSSTLLARKGHARPAMRPQVGGIDDLGWNDMGQNVPAVLVERAALVEEVESPTPAPVVEAAPIAVEVADVAPPEVTAPVSPPAMQPAVIEHIKRQVAAPALGRKAAFTLRLDAERHMRLRLTSAVSNRSAQQIVTEALDAFLSQQPGLDALVDRLPSPSR